MSGQSFAKSLHHAALNLVFSEGLYIARSKTLFVGDGSCIFTILSVYCLLKTPEAVNFLSELQMYLLFARDLDLEVLYVPTGQNVPNRDSHFQSKLCFVPVSKSLGNKLVI